MDAKKQTTSPRHLTEAGPSSTTEDKGLTKIREILFAESVKNIENKINETSHFLRKLIEEEINTRRALADELNTSLDQLRISFEKKLKTFDAEKVDIKKLSEFFSNVTSLPPNNNVKGR